MFTPYLFLTQGSKAERHKGNLVPIALQIQLDELPTACLELGQEGEVAGICIYQETR